MSRPGRRTSPHNIQRKTWQTANCNNCHGNRDLFLSEKDLLDYEIKANASVVVPDNKVPKKREKVMPLNIDTSKVKTNMVVDAAWLHKNLGKVKVVDARAPGDYAKGHIEGAVNIDPIKAGLRHSWDDDNPMELIADDKLAAILGAKGLKADDHIVVYDKDGRSAGYIMWVLDYAGAKNISYVNGGIEALHHEGLHTTDQETKVRLPPSAATVNKECLCRQRVCQQESGRPTRPLLLMPVLFRRQKDCPNMVRQSVPGEYLVPLICPLPPCTWMTGS